MLLSSVSFLLTEYGIVIPCFFAHLVIFVSEAFKSLFIGTRKKYVFTYLQ